MPNKHHPPHHPTPPPRALMRLSATHSPLPFPIPFPPLFSISLSSILFPFSSFLISFFPFSLLLFSLLHLSFSLFPFLLFSFLFSFLLFPLFSEIQFFSSPLFFFFFSSLSSLSRLHIPITVPAVSPAGPPSLPLTRACAFIILYYCPSFPAPSRAGIIPSFFALRAPNSLPWQPYFAVFMPESNFFRMFFQKTSANIWWNGKVGVPLHPQTRKGHPCGAGAVTYARSASLVCAMRSLKD